GAAPSDAGEAGAWLPGGQVDGIDPDSERGAALRYSPQTRQAAVGPNELAFVESPSLSESVNRMLQPLANRLSRRSRYTIRGKEISLRRILRKNIQFGGELILLDFRRKKMKRRRVIFLCDVSGSMDIYTLLMLQFVHALRRVDPKTEVFFFSTNLTRVTPLFDAESFSTALFRLPQLVEDWGGGTRIGYCLERFNQVHARRFHPSKAIVMIFSDGWDRGEIDLLEEQMAHLKRRAYKIIWINPLLGTKDYQPICRGMRAALPYVDYFLPAGGARDLRLLGTTLEKMIA
ncbi:MAG: VWA domain-containing protein, partial [Candidatus Bipolaricaulia bacterium]